MDDRGHFIGDQFGGAPRLENLFPQDAEINKGIYKSLEDQLAKQVRNGKDVYVDIKPLYEYNSKRPTKIIFKYSIDGEKFLKIFPNDRSQL
jgi:DNA/RNA endonuclease G (NUC1)